MPLPRRRLHRSHGCIWADLGRHRRHNWLMHLFTLANPAVKAAIPPLGAIDLIANRAAAQQALIALLRRTSLPSNRMGVMFSETS